VPVVRREIRAADDIAEHGVPSADPVGPVELGHTPILYVQEPQLLEPLLVAAACARPPHEPSLAFVVFSVLVFSALFVPPRHACHVSYRREPLAMPNSRAIRERHDERNDNRIAKILQGVIGRDPGHESVLDPGEPKFSVIVAILELRNCQD